MKALHPAFLACVSGSICSVLAGSAAAQSTAIGVGTIKLITPQGQPLYPQLVAPRGSALLRSFDPLDPRVFRFTPGVGLQQVSVGGVTDFEHWHFAGGLTNDGTTCLIYELLDQPPNDPLGQYRVYRATVTPVNLPPQTPVPPVPPVALADVHDYLPEFLLSEDGKRAVGQLQYSGDIVSISPTGAVSVLAPGASTDGEAVWINDVSNDGTTVLLTRVFKNEFATCEFGPGYESPPHTEHHFNYPSRVEVCRNGAVSVVNATLENHTDAKGGCLSGDGRYAFCESSRTVVHPDMCNTPDPTETALLDIMGVKVDLVTHEVTSLGRRFTQRTDFNGTARLSLSRNYRRIYEPPAQVPPEHQWRADEITEAVGGGWELLNVAANDQSIAGSIWSRFRLGIPPAFPTVAAATSVFLPKGDMECLYLYNPYDLDTGELTDHLIAYALPIDPDGDGIPDGWERPIAEGGGIDGDGDGIPDLDIYARGARPGRKDLFLEIDSAPGMMPGDYSVERVVEAFDLAPIANIDGSTGIALHIELGESALPSTVIATGGNFPDDLPQHKRDHFGTLGERAGNWNAIRAAKLSAYRYMACYEHILTEQLAPVDYGGLAEIDGCNAVIAATYFVDYPERFAAVIMHEFGHNLGLRHGGADDVNYKPNHLSIMNYLLSYPSDFSEKFWVLDYSRIGCETIEENSVNEAHGLRIINDEQYEGLFYRDFRMPYKAGPGSDAPVHTAPLDGTPIDFNGNGILQASISADLNWFGNSPIGGGDGPLAARPSPGEVLRSVKEWPLVRCPISLASILAQGATPGSLPVLQPVDTGEERPDKVLAFLNARIPHPCYADVGVQGGLSGHDNLLDNNDFIAFIDAFFNSNFAIADIGVQGGDFGHDQQLDNNDFVSFINEFFSACG